MNLGEIYAELKLKAGQFHKELGKTRGSVEKQAKLIGKAFLGVTAAIAGITYAMIRVTKSLVTAYSQQESAEKKLEAALKATGNQVGITKDQMLEMAAQLQDLTMYGDETVISAQSLMVTFKNIGREVFPDAIKAAMDMSTMFGQTLQQSVIQLGKALNAPTKGLGRLALVGIDFSEKQKKMVKGFEDANNIMGAQKIILDEIKGEFGGVSEAAANTTEGALTQLKNMFGDIKEDLGEKVAPTISMAARLLKTAFQEVLKSLDILLPSLNAMGESTDKANEAGLRFATFTTRAMFKIRKAVDRVKIVFWTLAGVFSKVIFGIIKGLTSLEEVWYQTAIKIAEVTDKVFRTNYAESLKAGHKHLVNITQDFKDFADLALARADELAGGLTGITNAEQQAVDRIIAEYQKLIETKVEALGAPPAPVAPSGGGGGGAGAGAALPYGAEEVDVFTQSLEETTDKMKSLDQAMQSFGSSTASWFKQGKVSGEDFRNELIKIAAQLVLMNILKGATGAGFFSGFANSLLSFGSGGVVAPPPFAANGLVVDSPMITKSGAVVGDRRATNPEVILNKQEMADMVYGLSHPEVHIFATNINAETQIKTWVKMSASAKQLLGRFLDEEVLPERNRLKGI